jgi:hypothetical protein
MRSSQNALAGDQGNNGQSGEQRCPRHIFQLTETVVQSSVRGEADDRVTYVTRLPYSCDLARGTRHARHDAPGRQ